MTKSQRNFYLPLIFLAVILIESNCYLQFKLTRVPHQSKKIQQRPVVCPQDTTKLQDSEYKEICYDKDITYSFEMFQNGQFNLISADFTTPISWLKSQNCVLKDSSKTCSRLQLNFKQTVHQYEKALKNKIHKKKHKDDDDQGSQQKYVIQGSSDFVEGPIDHPKTMKFQITDSSRLTKLFDIILLGYYILGETDQLSLQSTSFIKATQISPRLNYLCDGAISLRFDQNSQNSFLNQIFNYVKAQQKIVTVYLGQTNYLAIGQLSLKFSQYGYSGINWVNVQQDQNFGKLPKLTSVIIQDPVKQTQKTISGEYQTILTISASYIGLPEQLMTKISEKLAKSATCSVPEKGNGLLECTFHKKSDIQKQLQKKLTFSFGDTSISFPLTELVLDQQGKKAILNLKLLPHKDYIILGQPLFTRYSMYLDYGQNRVGFAVKRDHFQKQYINVVSLIRFLMFIFTFGCCFICCATPCRKLWTHLFNKQYVSRVAGKQGRRLRNYAPIQQNPYDQITDKIKNITASRATTQVDGHPDDQI